MDASCFPDLHDADRTARFAEHLIVHLVKRQDGWEIVEIFEGENNPHIHSKKKKENPNPLLTPSVFPFFTPQCREFFIIPTCLTYLSLG